MNLKYQKGAAAQSNPSFLPPGFSTTPAMQGHLQHSQSRLQFNYEESDVQQSALQTWPTRETYFEYNYSQQYPIVNRPLAVVQQHGIAMPNFPGRRLNYGQQNQPAFGSFVPRDQNANVESYSSIKRLNVDSPAFTPAALPVLSRASTISSAINAAPFTPRAMTSGKSADRASGYLILT